MSNTLAGTATEPHPPQPTVAPEPETEIGEPRNRAAIFGGLLILALFVLLIVASIQTDQFGRLVGVGVAIVAVLGASAGLFWASNLLVSQASVDWRRFRTLAGAVLGAAGFGLLRGNRSVNALIADEQQNLVSDGELLDITDNIDLVTVLEQLADPELVQYATGWLGLVEWPIVGALLGAAAGWGSGAPNRIQRIALTIVPALIAGWLVGSNLLYRNRPDTSILTIVIWAAIGAAVGAGVGAVTKKVELRALAGAAIGATTGAWFVPDVLGTGSLAMAIAATMIPLALLAVRFAWPDARTAGEIADFNRRARAFIFVAPALTFVSATLVVPALRTIYTSLLDRESEEWVGLDNYSSLISSEAFLDTSRFSNLWTSQLFWVAVALILVGVAVGFVVHNVRNGSPGFERTGGSVGATMLGLFLLAFAVFVVIRGTFSNTLWWMLTVTVASTLMGLTIAVLAERAGSLESLAKSLVFMPMAISFVGASIIWRFQYQPRNITKDQSGVLNALWIELGKLSHSGWPRILGLIVLAALLAVTVNKIVGRVRDKQAFAGFTAVFIVLAYLFIELLRRSLGGFAILDDGSVIADTVAFREAVTPFNNVFLMFIMIWIQTGFAMVILSAAIKAVPQELLEAARIDGATESQQFFHVIVPQIAPTIGVVVTATLVAVVKVFDIVKVSTGGNFGTNVLANDFFTEAFQFTNRGVGSAIAIIILLIVAPVLILNVRQMQREEA